MLNLSKLTTEQMVARYQCLDSIDNTKNKLELDELYDLIEASVIKKMHGESMMTVYNEKPEEVMQYLRVELLKAIRKYDPNRKSRFFTFFYSVVANFRKSTMRQDNRSANQTYRPLYNDSKGIVSEFDKFKTSDTGQLFEGSNTDALPVTCKPSIESFKHTDYLLTLDNAHELSSDAKILLEAVITGEADVVDWRVNRLSSATCLNWPPHHYDKVLKEVRKKGCYLNHLFSLEVEL